MKRLLVPFTGLIYQFIRQSQEDGPRGKLKIPLYPGIMILVRDKSSHSLIMFYVEQKGNYRTDILLRYMLLECTIIDLSYFCFLPRSKLRREVVRGRLE